MAHPARRLRAARRGSAGCRRSRRASRGGSTAASRPRSRSPARAAPTASRCRRTSSGRSSTSPSPSRPSARDQEARRWTRRVSEPLAGKTLGILGLGAIGQEVARKAAALELTVIGTRREPAPVPHVARVFPPEGTGEVLGAADFVLLLLPVTPATRDFMDARRLARDAPDGVAPQLRARRAGRRRGPRRRREAGRHRGRRPRRLPHRAPARRPPVLDDARHHRAAPLRRAPSRPGTSWWPRSSSRTSAGSSTASRSGTSSTGRAATDGRRGPRARRTAPP